MAGNAQRRGAVRRQSSKKGATVGSGGQRRRQLKGKGPTPKATDRTGHPAARRAAAAKRAARTPNRPDGDRPETIAGRNAVVEALRAGIPVKTMYIAERIDSDDRVREALRAAAARGLPVLEAPRPELDRIAGDTVHQGLALQIPPYDYAYPDDLLDAAKNSGEAPLIVALDGVTDPRNLGAIVRSAAAFGAHGVLIPERRAAGMSAGAWKASAGAASRLRVARTTNLARQLRDYAAAGLFIVGLAANGDIDVGQLDLAESPLVLVVGSEGKGLSRIVAQACDQVAAIPMISTVESLNAGVAAGIALYAVARQRHASTRGEPA
jgi:23S rRNA (guanosine2251-2'-O)-methyltransferase